jgi:hypothetical protein
MGLKYELDLPRIHLQAAGDDELLQPAGDREVAV